MCKLVQVGLTLFTALFGCAIAGSAKSQEFPARSISIASSVAPGAPIDLLARLFIDRLRVGLGVPVVLDNVTGGQGLTATLRVLNAKPNGHTLLIASGGVTTAPIVMKNAGYKAEDFVAIAALGQVPYILYASNGVTASDIPTFMDYLKANFKDMNSGILTTSYLSMLLSRKFSTLSGGDLTEIGFRGSPQMVTSLMTNEIQMMASTYSVGAPHLSSGKIKAIGVVANERTKNMPDLPTFKEKGYPSLVISIWAVLFARADTPPDILAKLRSASQEVVSDPSYIQAMEPTGMEPWTISIDKLQQAIDEETRAFASDAAKYNLKVE